MVRIAAIAGLLRSGEDSQVQEIFESTLRNESPFVRHAALIELDAAGLPIIKASRSLLEQLPEEEYGGRVAAHVMSRLTGTTAP
jgi:HEAT repeat protein